MHPYSPQHFGGENPQIMLKTGAYLFPESRERRILAHFARPQGELSTGCGFVDNQNWFIGGKLPQSQNPPFWAKNMQRMHRGQAGIRRRKREYIGEWDFLHRGVDVLVPSSTILPKPKRQENQGVQPLFHSFHRAYSCCYLIIYLQLLFLFWAGMHTAEKRSSPVAKTDFPIRLEVISCSLP